jgi:hypothetical protein
MPLLALLALMPLLALLALKPLLARRGLALGARLGGRVPGLVARRWCGSATVLCHALWTPV